MVPDTSMTSVWLPAASPLAENMTAARRGGGANASTVATSTPSSSTRAMPHTSQRTPSQLTPVPVNVKVAVAPTACEKRARSPLSVAPMPVLVTVNHASAGANVAASSSKRAIGGGALATVTADAAEVAVLPASSRATAVSVCPPSGTPVVSQATA